MGRIDGYGVPMPPCCWVAGGRVCSRIAGNWRDRLMAGTDAHAPTMGTAPCWRKAR